jgi:energy-coupling factor transporter transmembrane protein EcfT
MSASRTSEVAAPERARRREAEITFLRLVPGDTPVHRLWAGTKLVAAAELALAASVAPTWFTLGVLTGLVLIGLLVARIPLGAFPRLPRGLYLLLVLGLGVNALSTTKPVWDVGPLPVSLGALSEAVRFLALAVVLITSAALVGWTTPLGTVAPALARLAAPLRRIRLPVDEWIVAIGLALRCLPLLVDEMRTLAAARRLRHRDAEARRQARRSVVEIHDLISTAIIVSLRRARDLADAIAARGGIGTVGGSQDGTLTWRDAFVMIGVTAIVVLLMLAGR